MYIVALIVLMGVAPLASIAVDALISGKQADYLFLITRWFVFWAIGARLFAAGVKQTLDPAFTAETIFGVFDKSSHRLVSEIGFGNLAIGTLGLLTILRTDWVVPAAIVGALFLGLAGLKHALNTIRTGHENIAMMSDIAGATVVGLGAAGLLLR